VIGVVMVASSSVAIAEGHGSAVLLPDQAPDVPGAGGLLAGASRTGSSMERLKQPFAVMLLG
jgi:hypothetical protein